MKGKPFVNFYWNFLLQMVLMTKINTMTDIVGSYPVHSSVSTSPQRSWRETYQDISGKNEALKKGIMSGRSVTSGQTHAEVRRSFLKRLNIQSTADSCSSASSPKHPPVGRYAFVAALRFGSSSVDLSDRLKNVQSEARSPSSAGLVSADVSAPVSLENVKKIDLDVKKPVCRFFTKGHCRRGASCRYLHHPGVHDKVIIRLVRLVAPNFVKYRKHTNSGGKFCICDYLYL